LNLLGWFFERFFLLFLETIAVVWLRVAHQLFFPFVSEPDEHVFAWAFQAFGVVLDKPDETVDVIVFFEVNGQYVARGRLSPFTIPSRRTSNVPCWGLSESKPTTGLHSTIELPVTTRHCEVFAGPIFFLVAVLDSSRVDHEVFTIAKVIVSLVAKPSFSYTRIASALSVPT